MLYYKKNVLEGLFDMRSEFLANRKDMK